MRMKQSEIPDAKGREVNKAASIPFRLLVGIGLLLILVTGVAYWHTLGSKFITDFDDGVYVTNNPCLTQGLNLWSLRWAMTTFHAANWHPLTWLSHITDYQLYGLNPMGHHFSNLLFHIANTLLLFLLLTRMTGAVWKSALVAALFAIHPIHVESVAWVAERKDLLSTFFWLITMHSYVSYANRPRSLTYVAMLLCFGLGLMAKPMLVTLPLVLLMLDYWPLGRMYLGWRLVWEKTPLVAMSIASCIVTMVAQRSGGAVATLVQLPLAGRIANAVVSYVEYILAMLWPRNLSAFYPHHGAGPILTTLGAAVLLIAVSSAVLWKSRHYPYLGVGWLWYLVTLVPVIGLVQVGSQSMADRYSYMTLTGLFVIVAWGVPDLIAARSGAVTRALPLAAVALIITLAVSTYVQTGYWRDESSLFARAIKVTPNNSMAYLQMGLMRDRAGQANEAAVYLKKSVDCAPDSVVARLNLGRVLIKLGRTDEGFGYLRAALGDGPNQAEVHKCVAFGYYGAKDLDNAARECRIALKLDPKDAEAESLLAKICFAQGHTDRAIALWRSALNKSSDDPQPHICLAVAYCARNDYAAAWKEVHLYQAAGEHPSPAFLARLSSCMPEPK